MRDMPQSRAIWSSDITTRSEIAALIAALATDC
jgi:hypothetical protein